MSWEAEAAESNREEAQRIALQAGAIEKCPFHSDVLLDSGNSEGEVLAYKIGVAEFRDKEIGGLFRNVREVTDAIKEAIQNVCYVCPSCAKD